MTHLDGREPLPADSVILSVGVRADFDLLGQLDMEDVEIRAIGDAASPRRIQDAIKEGSRTGRLV